MTAPPSDAPPGPLAWPVPVRVMAPAGEFGDQVVELGVLPRDRFALPAHERWFVTPPRDRVNTNPSCA